jgi:hypothetical protein
MVWISLSYPFWAFRSPNHTGGRREAWQRAMYYTVSLCMVAILTVKFVSPDIRITDSIPFWTIVVALLMVCSFFYLNSSHAARTLAIYAQINRTGKILLAGFWLAIYVGIFASFSELAPR